MGALATSYIPTEAAAGTRAVESCAEVEAPYPAKLDLMGAGETRSHIGLPFASVEDSGMPRLGADGGGLKEWDGELRFAS